MLVFIDESGDPGFKLDQGSSSHFITSMVIFQTNDAAIATQNTIDTLRKDLGVRSEFKFNKSKDEVRDLFFQGIRHCDFKCRFVCVDKSLIYTTALTKYKESFYKFFMKMMLTHDDGTLQNAKIILDGSGDRVFKREFCSYLKKHLPNDSIKSLTMKDSKNDSLVQLADMTAGAIARSYKTDRKTPDRWRKMLAQSGQISKIWDFK